MRCQHLWQRASSPPSSLRANGSRERAPDDRLREAIQSKAAGVDCFVADAPRNDEHVLIRAWLAIIRRSSLKEFAYIVRHNCFAEPQENSLGSDRLRQRVVRADGRRQGLDIGSRF